MRTRRRGSMVPEFIFLVVLPSFLALLSIFLSMPGTGTAHPGRLDEQGCHRVLKDFHYVSGKVAKKWTEHCHRHIGKWSVADKQSMKLDGKEVLMGPGEVDAPQTAGERHRDEARQSECIRRGGKEKTGLCP